MTDKERTELNKRKAIDYLQKTDGNFICIINNPNTETTVIIASASEEFIINGGINLIQHAASAKDVPKRSFSEEMEQTLLEGAITTIQILRKEKTVMKTN